MRRLFALIDRLHRNIDRTSQCSERARHQDGAEQPLASADGEKYDRGAGLTNGPLLFAGGQLRASAIGGNAWSASNSEHCERIKRDTIQNRRFAALKESRLT